MRTRIGFSVVEVLVALIIFSVAALGSAAAVGMAAREHLRASAKRDALDAVRVSAARLTSTPCDSLVAGAHLTRGITVEWTVERDSLVRVALSASYRGATVLLRAEVVCE